MDGGARQTTVYRGRKGVGRTEHAHTVHHTQGYMQILTQSRLFQGHHGLILLGLNIVQMLFFYSSHHYIENGKAGASQLKFNGWPLGCTGN